MAKRRSRRETRLAGMNMTAVLGGQPRQVEKFDHAAAGRKNFACNLGKPKALRHLARTGMLRAR